MSCRQSPGLLPLGASGQWRQLIAHRRSADPRCTLRPPGRGALSLFGPLASPGLIWRWPALGCAPAARRGGDLGGRRPCRERVQRGRGCAAPRGRALGSRGDGRRGWDACMSSKLPSAYASRAANGGEGVLEGHANGEVQGRAHGGGWRVTKQGNFFPSLFPIVRITNTDSYAGGVCLTLEFCG